MPNSGTRRILNLLPTAVESQEFNDWVNKLVLKADNAGLLHVHYKSQTD